MYVGSGALGVWGVGVGVAVWETIDEIAVIVADAVADAVPRMVDVIDSDREVEVDVESLMAARVSLAQCA